MKKISIVLPIYNEKAFWIKESINSILNQTYKNIELLLILDNPKNTNLVNFLTEFEKKRNVILIINEKNIGIVESLNKGIQLASGDFIARMDADDIAFSDRLQKELDFLEKYDLDIVTSTVKDIDENGDFIISREEEDLIGDNFKKEIRFRYLGAHPTWFGKKEAFKKIGGYRSINNAEDLDFLLRGLESGLKIGLLGKPTLNYRVRSSSITLNNQLEMFLNSECIRKFYKRKQLSNTSVSMIMGESSKITEKDKMNYKKISQIRKEAFYLAVDKNPLAIFKTMYFVSQAVFNRYARMLIMNDLKRMLRRK
ncbi:glycosyltransferase [Leuconostoc lactis]|uniref:glycosyltransferase n=1 Tax=Leuconostoc lactis TaxID=1246 RepID=UPI001D125CF4|nr:glycosyltransferase [Leuconostoc lactis]MCC2744917.1 glycosyltransferase [Leuconostoc lactis]MCC2755455.1 glycosyltransferase [Leuconostoc lactis]